jgi:thymidylate synthase (FAD)
MTPSVRLIGLTIPVHDEGFEDQLPFETYPFARLGGGLDLIEFAGRWDYGPKSVAKMASDPEGKIIARWLEAGEESMVEMVDAIFLITCSRVVSHELVRHRIASYQQESQRPADLFFVPEEIKVADTTGKALVDYQDILVLVRVTYNRLVEAKVPKQIARYVLPNAMRTRIIVKMNLREWRHVLQLRLHTSAQPEMREVMKLIHAKLQRIYGTVLFPDGIADERGTR